MLTKLVKSIEPVAPENLKVKGVNSSSTDELQFNRKLPSKSQCKDRVEHQNNSSNLKKSFSVVFFKASNSQTSGVPIIASSNNEYSCISREE
jgi:hypothetical protein